jgi:sec-independent protein translocase protein TatC
MASTLRPIGHEDRLSLVDHLDELRTRIIICLVAFSAAFALCLWQSDAILQIVNRPLEKSAFKGGTGAGSKDPFEQTAYLQQRIKAFTGSAAALGRALQADPNADPAVRAAAEAFVRQARATAAAVPPLEAKRPVTLGVGEPFTATLTVAAYAAMLLSLPLLLYQLYAFILPAFSPRERQVAVPLMLAVPFLFIAGVVFSYFVLLPRAVSFLQNFHDEQYDILIQARDYYKFSVTVLMAMGLCFQVPIVILAITRVGIISVQQLRRSRRYAILVIAIVAMLLPGQDPITMLTLMLPMVLLYEGSILFATVLDRRARRQREREERERDEEDLLPVVHHED